MVDELGRRDFSARSHGFGVLLNLLVGWRWTERLDGSSTGACNHRSAVSSSRVCNEVVVCQLGHSQGPSVVATIAAHCRRYLEVFGIERGGGCNLIDLEAW